MKDVTGSIAFAAASRGSAAMDGSSDLGHGVSTYFLLKGLGGEADTKRDGSIDLDEMEHYLRFNVTKYTNCSQIPFVTSEGYKLTSFPINRSSTPEAKIFVLAIGVNPHSSPYFLRLRYPVLDAQGVADLYRSKFGHRRLY